MQSNNFKKNLRKINFYARELNNSILNDELWKGRFYVTQKAVSHACYEDGSGMEMHVLYEFVDLKTGITASIWFDPCVPQLFRSHLFNTMNTFIVEGVKAWDNSDDSPRNDKTRYRTDNARPHYVSQPNAWIGKHGIYGLYSEN